MPARSRKPPPSKPPSAAANDGGGIPSLAMLLIPLILTLLLADHTLVLLIAPQTGAHPAPPPAASTTTQRAGRLFASQGRCVWWCAALGAPLIAPAAPRPRATTLWAAAAWSLLLPPASRIWSLLMAKTTLPLHLGPYAQGIASAAVGAPLFAMITWAAATTPPANRQRGALLVALFGAGVVAYWGAALQLPWPVATGVSATSVAAAALPLVWGAAHRAAMGAPLEAVASRSTLMQVLVWSLLAALLAGGRCQPRKGLPAAFAVPHARADQGVEQYEYDLVWSGECRLGGHLSIADAALGPYRYRMLKYEHSLLGGVYTQPANVSGQSIYGAFYLQGATRALALGLGVGFAVGSLQERGVVVDVMELYDEVIFTAKTLFGFTPSGSVWAGDAVATVRMLAAQHASARVDGAPPRRYDIILHDAFSGGGVPQVLYTRAFVKELAGLLEDDGVLALNYVGSASGCLPYIADLLRESIPHVRVFQDTTDDVALKNYVFFASRQPLVAAQPTAEDVGNDGARAQYFTLLPSYEVTELLAGWVGGGGHARCFGQAGMWELAEAHWLAMAASFPPGFWAHVTY